NNISPCVAKRRAVRIRTGTPRSKGLRWRAEGSGVEKLRRRRVADRDRLAGDVRAQRTADAAADVDRVSEHTRCEIQAAADCEVAAPLPAIQNVRERALRREPVVFAKWQVVDPVAGKLVTLIETRQTAIGRDVERILRHDYATAPNRRRIVDRFRINIVCAESYAVRHALAHADRTSMKHRVPC